MLTSLLDETRQELLLEERRLLHDISQALVRCDVAVAELQVLTDSIEQLDTLFLLVVVGEFNAGKSAFLNALLGQQLLAEGVTPTTAEIHLIGYGDQVSVTTIGDGLHRVSAPVELLRQVTLVDTPGTNALERRHEAITTEFVPRSDLVIFVTSADRPLSESERGFLASIRSWGKKILLVLNKADILPGPEAEQEVCAYLRDHCRRLLGFEPELFRLSATQALAARRAGDSEALAASGMAAFEQYLLNTLDDAERVRLKLLNPLGVAGALVKRSGRLIEERQELLAEDVLTINRIDQQLDAYAEDVEHELGLRLADIDNSLFALERRGYDFFEDNLRLSRVKTLLNRDLLRSQFEHQVVADEPQLIEAKVESLIDWLVSSDLSQWQAVMQYINNRRQAGSDRMVGDISGRFAVDRSGLLERVGRATRESLKRFDRSAEARRLADDVQRAVAGTALVEVSAVGLGATVSLLATSTVADATGLAAAGLLAVLGLFLLPNRRRQATRQLQEKIAVLRRQLLETISVRFRQEATASLAQIRETIKPYTRFVRAEQQHLQSRRCELDELGDRVAVLTARLQQDR